VSELLPLLVAVVAAGAWPCSGHLVPTASSDGARQRANRAAATVGYPRPVTAGWHIAQVNIALLRAPLDSPELEGFVSMLAPINALADSSPGFVWRLQGDAGDATGIRAFGDDRIIVNLSVWESIEALGQFVFASRHTDVLRRRREWFEKMADAYLALWWIPAGTIPTIQEAERRVAVLRDRDVSSDAFTLREPFPAPGSNVPVPSQDRWRYPTTPRPV
jgi:Domain of unknown function (DUF3291)